MSEAAPDRLLLRLRRRAALVLWTETLCHAAMPAAFILAAWLVAVIFGFGGFLLFSRRDHPGPGIPGLGGGSHPPALRRGH